MVGVEEQKKKLWNVMRRISKLNREEEALSRQRVKEEIRYHGPYTDASGQAFYLPQKYVNDRVQRVDYDFRENEDLDGDKLLNNLSWLGKSGDIMNLVQMQSEDDDDDGGDEDDDESTYPPPSKKTRKEKKNLSGGGVISGCNDEFLNERSLRKALPDITQTLSNWTVHGQNLGHMADSYKKKSRTMPIKKRLQIGNFFNTASNVLDTIGSMTENTILNSVQFVKGGKGIMGSSSIERSDTDLSNHPPINLPPTPLNMTRYSAKYTSQGPLNRNVLVPGETYNELMYSGRFPVYPVGVQLRHNPNRNNVDFAYDSDKGNTSEDDDEDGSESLGNSSGEAESSSDDSDGSYV